MPTKHYVIAQRSNWPHSTKRLCGPFDTPLAAARMVRPVSLAMTDDPEYAESFARVMSVTISAKDLKAGKAWPVGALEPGRIDLADIIEASKL